MRFLKSAVLAAAVAFLALSAPQAQAGNTILFSSQSGDITFPFTAPTTSPSAAGTIDNMTIGATTPKAGNFTTLTATTAPTGAGITALFASPPAIGGTAAAAGTFTTLTGTAVTGSTSLTGAGYFGSGSAPTPTGTGTPTIASGSTDTAGEVTAGASATSVVITFASAKTNAPFCVVRSQSQITSFAYTISTTAITITQTATSGNLIDYICFQH